MLVRQNSVLLYENGARVHRNSVSVHTNSVLVHMIRGLVNAIRRSVCVIGRLVDRMRILVTSASLLVSRYDEPIHGAGTSDQSNRGLARALASLVREHDELAQTRRDVSHRAGTVVNDPRTVCRARRALSGETSASHVEHGPAERSQHTLVGFQDG